MKVKELLKTLQDNGYNPVFIKSEEPQLEDDSITITPKVDIQVTGCGTAGVAKHLEDGTFLGYPARTDIKDLLSDLAEAVKARFYIKDNSLFDRCSFDDKGNDIKIDTSPFADVRLSRIVDSLNGDKSNYSFSYDNGVLVRTDLTCFEIFLPVAGKQAIKEPNIFAKNKSVATKQARKIYGNNVIVVEPYYPK